MNLWPWLLSLALLAVVGWGLFAFVLPALGLQAALRRMVSGEGRDAAAFLPRRGRFTGAVDDLAILGERLHDAQRQLGDRAFDLQAILGSLTEGVVIVDAAQRIRLANESLQRMFDLPAPPLGRTLLEVFRDHELPAAVRVALEQATPQSRELTLDARQAHAVGEYTRKHFAVTAAALPAHRDAPPRGAIAIFHDISALKALESVRRDFVANVSHELRTPVAIINGYLETLLDGALHDPPTAQKFLNVMWKHNQRLTLLIEDLLSVSQLESQRAAGLHFEPVNLRACLEQVVERLEAAIGEKAALVQLALPDDLPPVEGDPHRLDQVFFNLIENALKYGESTDRPAEISVAASVAGDEALVTVADHGPGIPLADQPHVFERFYRVHKDRSRAVGGTGLGLSIVKHVVQAHGGQVSVESQPGRGATFRVRLPVSQKG